MTSGVLVARERRLDARQRRELRSEERRDLARDPVDGEAVGAVARHLDLEHLLAEREHVASGVPGSHGSGRTRMPAWSAPSSSSGSERIIPSETLPRSFARSSVRPSGSTAPGKRDRDRRAGAEVPRAADDLARLALAHVDAAELEPVGVRVLARLDDAPDAEEAEVAVVVGDAAVGDALDLAGGDRQPVGELGSGASTSTYSRSQETGIFTSELPEQAEVVLPEQAERRQAVAEHGDPLEAEPEREAATTPRGRARRTRRASGRPCPSRPSRSSPSSCRPDSRRPSQRKQETSGSIDGSVNGK